MGLDFLQILSILFDYFVYSSDNQWMKVVSVECKALSNWLIMRWQLSSKSIKSNLIIIIKVLKHSNYFLNRHHTQIFIVILMMQRLCPFKSRIGVVDSENQMQSGPIHYISQKRFPICFLPLMNNQITNNKPVFLDSLWVTLLLTTHQCP